MSAYKFVTLTCDICFEIWDGANTTSVREARAIAKRVGWVSSNKGDRDECPKHHGFRRTNCGGWEREVPE